MSGRKHILLSAIIGISMIHLAGCGSESDPAGNLTGNIAAADMESAESDMPETEAGTAMLSAEKQDETESQDGAKSQDETESQDGAESQGETETQDRTEEQGQEESEPETDERPKEAPHLPATGRELKDFVPEGWKILDSIELDFNQDKIPDYVGVLEAVLMDADGYRMYPDYPRILFAIASDGGDGYLLDFQDINLIRTRDEGGVFGDPYEPLTAEGTSFTTHAYGGSAWRWSEDNTYAYREGTWWLASSEETYGYGDYTTSYSKDDWESGVGIRKERSSEFSDMEENWEPEGDEYDVVYELALDEPLTLEQAGKRWWLAPERVTDWEVEKIEYAKGVELSENMVKLPDEAYLAYCDEDCVLYTFNSNPDSDKASYCLAMYCWQDRVLSVLAKEESEIDYPTLYKGKIYYSSDIVEKVPYSMAQDGTERVTEEDTVGVKLNRMNLDGTGKETVFEYCYQENAGEIVKGSFPFLSLIYEISGDEIFAEVYIGDEPHPFYRMKTDGSGQKKIGQMPKG